MLTSLLFAAHLCAHKFVHFTIQQIIFSQMRFSANTKKWNWCAQTLLQFVINKNIYYVSTNAWSSVQPQKHNDFKGDSGNSKFCFGCRYNYCANFHSTLLCKVIGLVFLLRLIAWKQKKHVDDEECVKWKWKWRSKRWMMKKATKITLFVYFNGSAENWLC